MTPQQKGPLPDIEFNARGGVSSAVWSREEKNERGEAVTRFSIKLQKSFKNSQTEKWENIVMNIFPNEWPRLRLVGDKAFEYAMLRENEQNGEPAAA